MNYCCPSLLLDTTSSKTALDDAATRPNSSVTNPHADRDTTPRLSPPLPTALEVNAAAFFLKGFDQPPRAGFPGYMSYLPTLLADTHGSLDNHHLHEAVLAAGCANLANVSGLSHLGSVARCHYGRALRTLAVALYAIIQVVPDLSGPRREYFLAALARIGHVKGIALALRVRDRWSGRRDVEMGSLSLVY